MSRLSLRMRGDAGAAKPVILGIGAGLAVVALVVAGYVVGYNRGSGKTEGGGEVAKTQSKKEPTGGGGGGTAVKGPGKSLFTEKCGSCHTLSDAGTSGAVGPNLDQTQFDAKQIRKQIEDGSAAMPAGLATGKDAKEIADYVAKIVGK